MPNQENNIEIRSEEVQEILSHVPNWLIRWGITAIFFVIFIILIASWFIKYPDTVAAKVILTTEIPPVHMVASMSGRIDLIKDDKSNVNSGEWLAIVENPAKTQHVQTLLSQLEVIKSKIYKSQVDPSDIPLDASLDLGTLQSSYSSFLSIVENAKRFNSIALYKNQQEALSERITYYGDLNNKFQNRLELLEEEISISKGVYLDDSLLYTQASGTKTEMNRSKANYLSSKRSGENLRSSVIQNNIQIAELKSRISELKLDEQESSGSFETRIVEAYERLENDLQVWKQSFLIISPIEGKLSFSKYWSDNQYVQQGEVVMTVIPDSQDIIGNVAMPIQGSGKVEKGQKVNMKLENYPYNEYGMVIGKIESISLVPRDNLYQIRISLPSGLSSTYSKELAFKQEMQGVAEIITEDKRLIERIFSQLRNILDKAG